MKLLDILVLIALVLALFGSLFFLWKSLPTESKEYQDYIANLTNSAPSKSIQFYPNMRYKEPTIPYTLSQNCSQIKKNDIESAFRILESKTPLLFIQDDSDPSLFITCRSTPIKPDQEGHYIAGEGGPTKVINTSRFAIILAGEVAIFRDEKCESPQVALHEILHALGFDHNNNKSSIMNPITECDQQIDLYILQEISRLYATPSLPDISIETIKANKTGRELNFELVAINQGLRTVDNVNLELTSNGKTLASYNLGKFDMGTRKKYSVTRERIPGDAKEIQFRLITNLQELESNNNHASIRLVEQ